MLKALPLLLFPLMFILLFYNTRWRKISIYTCLFFFISGTILYFKGSQRINSYQFRGIITGLTYGRNKVSSVTVDGKIYKYVLVEFFKDKIAIGDSLIKNKNSNGMTLIKKYTNEKIALKFEDATGYVEYD
ncbi:hypothetical protein [Pedobacter sp. MR22-3]|uniref:hypothetical protein n=1 Tax=Pedobacter sp. MR22-3 TaxID=2994552 RepID=UPI002246F18B|nr:hypothetical protein [Pedobacter sp. MR22-3]MCX2584399.1 hypothetical protein [Pedobacter sp. MR22-3]